MKVKLTYFKKSGKYYTEAEYDSEYKTREDWLVFQEVSLFQRDRKLPGLSSGTWNGYVLVSPLYGVPALLDFTSEEVE